MAGMMFQGYMDSYRIYPTPPLPPGITESLAGAERVGCAPNVSGGCIRPALEGRCWGQRFSLRWPRPRGSNFGGSSRRQRRIPRHNAAAPDVSGGCLGPGLAVNRQGERSAFRIGRCRWATRGWRIRCCGIRHAGRRAGRQPSELGWLAGGNCAWSEEISRCLANLWGKERGSFRCSFALPCPARGLAPPAR